MTASRFKEARHSCVLTIPQAAQLLRVSERTVHNWERGRVRVPYAAFKLMRILRGYELPGHQWKGYRLIGDTLWSPEGLAFKAEHQRWWSLTCRMANEFRAIIAAQHRLSRHSAIPARLQASGAEGGAVAQPGTSNPGKLDGSVSGLVSSETSYTPHSETQQNRGLQLSPAPTPNRPFGPIGTLSGPVGHGQPVGVPA